MCPPAVLPVQHGAAGAAALGHASGEGPCAVLGIPVVAHTCASLLPPQPSLLRCLYSKSPACHALPCLQASRRIECPVCRSRVAVADLVYIDARLASPVAKVSSLRFEPLPAV